jgi:hypothetical protein
MVAEAGEAYAVAAAQTQRIETQRRHAMEVHSKTLAAIHDLEIRLGIATRWRPGDAEWVAATKMLGKRRYQRALDELEGLVVARMFELSKVNMGDTGKLGLWNCRRDTDMAKGTSCVNTSPKRFKRARRGSSQRWRGTTTLPLP